MKINFEELKQEAIQTIEKNKIIVLATSCENKVIARAMSCVNDGFKIYFQTGTATRKYIQIKENPNVSLCCSNISIEGTAKILAHPLEEEEFIKKYEKDHNGSYKAYSFMKNEVVIEVEPIIITFWKYIDGNPYRDILDTLNKTAVRELYDTSDRV